MLRQLVFVTFKFQTNSQNVLDRRAVVTGLIVGTLCFWFSCTAKSRSNYIQLILCDCPFTGTFPFTNATSRNKKFTPFSDRRFHWWYSIDHRKRWSLHYKHVFSFVFTENTLSFLHLRHFLLTLAILPQQMARLGESSSTMSKLDSINYLKTVCLLFPQTTYLKSVIFRVFAPSIFVTTSEIMLTVTKRSNIRQ
jgi:hypothetical protein